MLNSLATLGGPVAAAALLAVSGPSVVFGACSVASLLGGLVVVALPYDAPPCANRHRRHRVTSRTGLAGLVPAWLTVERVHRGQHLGWRDDGEPG